MTPKQSRFVKAYLANGLNATQAAITAGYSAKTAASIGEENLKKPEIAKAIAAHTEKVMKALDYGVERVLNQIARMAFFDPRKLYDANGKLRPIHDLDEDTVAAIAGMDINEDVTGMSRTSKIKLADRGSALDKLMRYHALYSDKTEVTHKFNDELAERLRRAQERLNNNAATGSSKP